MRNQKDLKLESDNAATMYVLEKDRVCSIFPQFQDIVENLEGGATFDVDLLASNLIVIVIIVY